MKNKILFVFILIIIFSSIVFANSMVQDVYYSSFPITVNGQAYISEMPILNYQGRTYLPLREFGNVTGVNVDFQNSTIIVDNFNETSLKFFLYDSFMILNDLSKIDKNVNLILDSYVNFLGNTDPYATANITNLVNTNKIYISEIQEYNYVGYFKTWGEALGLDNDKKISTLHSNILNYINDVENFNQTITDAMYFKTSYENVYEKWDKLYDDYQNISNELAIAVMQAQ